MLEFARKIISFFHSAGLAMVVALLALVAAAADPVAAGWLAGLTLLVYAVTWWYILMELNHRATKMIKSLVYENLSFEFKYHANGDFRSRCLFKLRNHGTEAVSALPVTRAFFLSDGTITSVFFRAIDEGRGIYRFQKSGQSIVDAVSALFKNKARFVEWEYEISPPLAAGDSAAYEVIIEAEGTERAAFTSAGSIMGFPAHIPVDCATLRAVAPSNFRFVPIGHPVVVDIDMKAEVSGGNPLPDPVLSPSLEILDWKLRDLAGGHRYWIKYRFEQEVFDGA